MDINIESDNTRFICHSATIAPKSTLTRYSSTCYQGCRCLVLSATICNHLPPLFYSLPLFYSSPRRRRSWWRRSWWLQVSTYKLAVADKSVSATLSATLQPTEYQSVTRIFKQRLQMADENENYFSCLSNVQLELIAKQAIFTSKIIRSLTNHKLYVHYTDI